MFRAVISKAMGGARSRSISFAAKNCDKVPPAETTAVQGKLKSQLTSFEQKILVWTKKYESIEAIPERVAYETLSSATTRFRVKVCNYMIVATIIGCITMIISGKRAAARGESTQKANAEWHRKYNEEMAAKEAAKAAKVE